MSGKPFPDSVVTEAEVSMLLLNFLPGKRGFPAGQMVAYIF